MPSKKTQLRVALVLAVCFIPAAWCAPQAAAAKRPMTFLDVMEMRSPGKSALSPDGRRMLYTLSVPNWKVGRAFADIWLASTDGAVNKELTFTPDKNETNPRWSPDGKYFVFASDRDATTAETVAPGEHADGEAKRARASSFI